MPYGIVLNLVVGRAVVFIFYFLDLLKGGLMRQSIASPIHRMEATTTTKHSDVCFNLMEKIRVCKSRKYGRVRCHFDQVYNVTTNEQTNEKPRILWQKDLFT